MDFVGILPKYEGQDAAMTGITKRYRHTIRQEHCYAVLSSEGCLRFLEYVNDPFLGKTRSLDLVRPSIRTGL